MAVSVLQQPTTPNVTGTNLVYVLSSSLAGAPQYRFVTDIYESGSNDYITTVKTYPNLLGSGIIDFSRELNDQLEYDYNWDITASIGPINSVKTFNLKFGEEYGTSLSSSITTYTGSSDNYLQVFPGTVYKNQGSWNFNPSASFIPSPSSQLMSDCPEVFFDVPGFDVGPPLYYTPLELTTRDYHTITKYDGDELWVAHVFDVNGTSIYGKVYSAASKVPFSTLGVGPANLIDWDSNFATAFADPTALYVSIQGLGGENYQYYVNQKCGQEYTRFAWINSYGFWDYYNSFTPLRRTTQVGRSFYERPFVRYEDYGIYNISDRGTSQYRAEYKDNFFITTEFLDELTSQWLTNMFNSPEVYIQTGSGFIPINILNTSVDWDMNENRQKLFQYNIEFTYANERYSR